MEFRHESVLVCETISALNIKEDGIYVDATLGGGGHSFKIVQRLKTGRLIGIDQDAQAIEAAAKRLKLFKDRISLVNDNFVNIERIMEEEGISCADGILMDLGISSYQIDNPERGFSYRYDAALDMRMDLGAALSARDVVNSYSQKDLIRIIRDYGEERYAAAVASAIVSEREKESIETTGRLAEIVYSAIPGSASRGNPGAVKKTFQAIRIEVNSELSVLEESLGKMISLLNPKGRLAVITFHSLEDRIVKNAFKNAEDPCICPKELAVCVCGRKPLGRIITRKPVVPSEEERERNKRSSSAKLRVFEKK